MALESKGLAMAYHAIQRAYSRYGLVLTVDDLKQIVSDLHNNKGTLLKVMPDKRSAWLIEVKGKLCKIAVSADLWTICTFLPSNAYFDADGTTKTRGPRAKRRYLRGKAVYRDRRRA